jgi:hypothetical protein
MVKIKKSKLRKLKKVAKPVKTVVLANNQAPGRITAVSRPPRTSRSRGITPKHVSAVCSVTNPFCPAAKSSKWPDGTVGNTLTEQFRGNLTLGSSAQGNNVYSFAAAVPFGYLDCSANSATTGTFSAAYKTYKASSLLATYGSTYRIVSAGIIFRCVASATTASGLITIGTSVPQTVSTVFTLGQELYQECIIKAIQPGMEVTWIAAPIGSTAHEFVPQSTSAGFATATLPDWTSCTVEITGGPVSTPLIAAEWFINVEFMPGSGSIALASLATTNPPKSTVAETAQSHVAKSIGSFIEGGIRQVEDVVAKHASEALTAVMDNPFDALLALFP